MGILILPALLLAAIAIHFGVRYARKTRANWALAAQRLGLSFEGTSLFKRPVIYGTMAGCGVHLTTITRGSGKNSQTYTVFRLRFPDPLPVHLKLSREGFFSGFAKLFGAQDIQIGDATFDSEVIVKGADPEAIRDFLTPARRARIRHLFQSYPGAAIDREGVSLEERRTVRDPGRLEGRVRTLLRIALSLAAQHPRDQVLSEAVQARGEGRIEEALEILGADAGPGEPEERLLEAELLHLGGRDEQAHAVLTRTLEESRGAPDPQIRRWSKHLEAPPSPPPPTPPPPPPPPTPPPPPPREARDEPPPLDVKSLCELLLDPRQSSLDAERIFTERYAGRMVTWSGRLRSSSSCSYDYVFGSGEYIKATFTIHEMAGASLAGREVGAIVRLPATSKPALAGRSGETLGFSGRLLKIDALVYNFYLSDGELVPH